MIIDEVSMLFCHTMIVLNAQLMKIKNNLTVIFEGVNIIFFDDFLQFSIVSCLNLYVDNFHSQYALKYHL